MKKPVRIITIGLALAAQVAGADVLYLKTGGRLEGVLAKEIAEAIGHGLKVPVVAVPPQEAVQHFGFLGAFAGLDMPASSALTQERLGWHPTGPGLISDLKAMRFEA